MSKNYNDKLIMRDEVIDGETDWFWIDGDSGAWDGPTDDWVVSHKEKYLKYLKNRDVVVTAGANQGLYTRFYAKIFKAVYAFEPDALNFHVMTLNNQSDNIIKMNCALGVSASFLDIIRPDMTNTGMHHMANRPGIIPVLPIDAFNFPKIDLLQLDVEGYEGHVILGAVETIKRCKPVIVLERARSVPNLVHTMETLDYKLVDDSKMDSIFISNEKA
jgi:FkbM family methyltransferase